jgi:transcriptional regulator with XRE-family HTH domain
MINKRQLKRQTTEQAIPPGMVDTTKAPPPTKPPRFRAADEKSIGMRIKTARENLDLTQEQLAKRLTKESSGKPYIRSTVAQWERNDSVPPIEMFHDIAKELNTTPQFLAFGLTMEPKVVPPNPDELGYALMPEARVLGEDKFEEVSQWGLPTQWLRTELGVTAPDRLFIYKVEVDSAGFSYGDRVIIDRASNRASPPGKFLHWDGVGPVISNIVVVPAHGAAKKPIAKVTGIDGTYETDIDRLHIIGRAKGVWSKA